MSREIILAEVRVNGKASESLGRKHCSEACAVQIMRGGSGILRPTQKLIWKYLGVPGTTFEQQRVLVQRIASTILAEATVSSGGTLCCNLCFSIRSMILAVLEGTQFGHLKDAILAGRLLPNQILALSSLPLTPNIFVFRQN